MLSHSIGVIDIGSNTVLMTCGRLNSQGKLDLLLEMQDVARLSEGLQDEGKLKNEAKERVLNVLKKFKKSAQEKGIENIIAAGTAAFRRASDGKEFAKDIEKNLGIPTQILSGEQEAYYSFLSVENSFSADQKSLGMIDIGGGSTELVLKSVQNATSLPIGTVKLSEEHLVSHPISNSDWQALKEDIQQKLQNSALDLDQKPEIWVAVAATPTTLATYLQKLPEFNPQKVHGYCIQLDTLKTSLEKLRQLSIEDRNSLPGMLPKRAELLPIGGLILQEVMEFLKISEITVSYEGLRFGLLWENLLKD
ncbi:MAG: Ppx/GppA family phosphatase [Deltaproteobacteria bacterium]|nr:Ppx/GppA family phosphatase [Deltaproteobacteria bacterium]